MTSSPASPVRGWRRAALLTFGVVALGLGVAACTDDSGSGADLGLDTFNTSATVEGVDRDALLGELGEVRDLFATTSQIPPDVIADVAYDDSALTVTLAAEAEGVEDAQEICDDLSQGIQLPDLAITVEGPDGTRLASCEFGQ